MFLFSPGFVWRMVLKHSTKSFSDGLLYMGDFKFYGMPCVKMSAKIFFCQQKCTMLSSCLLSFLYLILQSFAGFKVG